MGAARDLMDLSLLGHLEPSTAMPSAVATTAASPARRPKFSAMVPKTIGLTRNEAEAASAVLSPGREVELRDSAVVVAGLEDDEVVAIDEVNEAVLLGDSSRPGSLKDMLERLGLPDALARMPQRIFDQSIDSLHHRPVGLLPGDVVLPPAGGEDHPHERLCGSVLPPRASASACCRRSALAGERSR